MKSSKYRLSRAHSGGMFVALWMLLAAPLAFAAEDALSLKSLAARAAQVASSTETMMRDIDSMRSESLSKGAPDEVACLDEVYDLASSNLGLVQDTSAEIGDATAATDSGYYAQVLDSYASTNDGLRRSANACKSDAFAYVGDGSDGVVREAVGPQIDEPIAPRAWADGKQGRNAGSDVLSGTSAAAGSQSSMTMGPAPDFDLPPPATVADL